LTEIKPWRRLPAIASIRASAIRLQEAIDRGEWVVSMADRIPLGTSGRVSWIPFLGEPAPFPQGPFILAALLKAPVFTMFCLREGRTYRVWFERLSNRLELPRSEREERLREAMEIFVPGWRRGSYRRRCNGTISSISGARRASRHQAGTETPAQFGSSRHPVAVGWSNWLQVIVHDPVASTRPLGHGLLPRNALLSSAVRE
jgi:hypothetical protein